MSRALYGWQEDCLEKWFANNCRGMVQAVTGSGKTLLALTAAARLEQQLGQELRIKIVVPTSALMLQWNRDLREFLVSTCKDKLSALNPPNAQGENSSDENFQRANLHLEIGMRGGGARSGPVRHYMIYVINSARYELARQILSELKQGKRVLMIADECHHYGSGQNQLIFEFLPYIKQWKNHFFSLGLSATLPAGQTQRYLASVLGRKIYHYGMAEASRGHTICPYDVYHISLPFQAREWEAYEEFSDRMRVLYRKLLLALPSLGQLGQKELFEELRSLTGNKNRKIAENASLYMSLAYKRKSLVCMASARCACAFDLVQRLDEKEKILIFSERTAQADALYCLLQKSCPEKVGRYHSKMGELANKNALERFRTGSIRILITCKAIDEGIDVPDASVGIILSGTSTQRQRIQRLGRIIRQKDAKEQAALYYLHIEDSSEDSCFLPDIKDRRLFELSYDPVTKNFYNPPYDAKATALLEKMQNAGVSDDSLEETLRCLRLGCVRSDWLLKQSSIDEHLQKARYASEKNYWICMKRMSQ